MRVDRSEPVKVTHIPCGEASESRVVKYEHGPCAGTDVSCGDRFASCGSDCGRERVAL